MIKKTDQTKKGVELMIPGIVIGVIVLIIVIWLISSYNGVVNRYNTKTELFPGNIIAGIFGFKRKPLFEVSNESERENVQVKF